MTINVQAGRLSANLLENWLSGPDFQNWVQAQTGGAATHALIEYAHRFAFTDWGGLIQDLALAEVARYGLRGRVFWETGQVTWRRLEGSTCGLCLVLESGPCPCLPQSLETAEEFDELLVPEDPDQTLLLWGKNQADGSAVDYLEQRVAGSRGIPYPPFITGSGKTYPILEVRTYLNVDKEPAMWRFLRPGARNKSEWA